MPTTDVGSQQDVLFDKLSLEDGKDYTINVVAENVVGKTSDALSKTVSVSTSKPTAAGKQRKNLMSDALIRFL